MILHEVKKGTVLRILGISGTRSMRRQLAQMGIQVGDTVQVKQCVPFGGPVLIEHRGTVVALGKSFAERVQVELCQ